MKRLFALGITSAMALNTLSVIPYGVNALEMSIEQTVPNEEELIEETSPLFTTFEALPSEIQNLYLQIVDSLQRNHDEFGTNIKIEQIFVPNAPLMDIAYYTETLNGLDEDLEYFLSVKEAHQSASDLGAEVFEEHSPFFEEEFVTLPPESLQIAPTDVAEITDFSKLEALKSEISSIQVQLGIDLYDNTLQSLVDDVKQQELFDAILDERIAETEMIMNDFDNHNIISTAMSDSQTAYSISNADWHTVEGIVGGMIQFDKGSGTITGSEPTITSAEIPSHIDGVEVKHIGDKAFYHVGNYAYVGQLEYVSLPDSISSIGDFAFAFWDVLDGRLTLGEGSTLTDVGNYAFYNTSAIIDVPSTIKNIGDYGYALTTLNTHGDLSLDSLGTCGFAFASASTLENITLKILDGKSFAYCTLPETIITIGDDVGGVLPEAAFFMANAKNLSISGIHTISKNGFHGANIPLFEAELKLDTMYDYAFYRASLPNVSITLVESFNNNENSVQALSYATLHDITLPGVTSVSSPTSTSGMSLYKITANTLTLEKLSSIDTIYSFSGCDINTLSLPSLTSIKENSALLNTTIGHFNATNLIDIKSYSETNTGPFNQSARIDKLTISSSTTELPTWAFAHSNIGEIVGLDKITEIPNYVFFGANIDYLYGLNLVETISSMSFYQSVIGKIENLDNVLEVRGSAFREATVMNMPELPNTTHIYNNAFSDCPYISQLVAPNLQYAYSEAFSSSNFEKIDIHILIGISTSTFQDVTVDEFFLTFDEDSSYAASTSAFSGLTVADEDCVIVLPSSTTTIYENSFYNATPHIVFTAPIMSISGGALYNASFEGLEFSEDSEITTIGANTFSYSTFDNLALPDTITSISAGGTFREATFDSLTLPKNITSIGSYDFYASTFGTIILPEALTTISSYAFRYATFDTLEIPPLVSSINSYYSLANMTGNKLIIDKAPILTSSSSLSNVFSSSKLEHYHIHLPDDATTFNLSLLNGVSADNFIFECHDDFTITNSAYPTLSNITVLGTSEVFPTGLGTIISNSSTTNVEIDLPITEIPNDAFTKTNSSWNQINQFKIPDSVTYIGQYAFRNSSSTLGNLAITLPNNLREVDNYGFYNLNVSTSIIDDEKVLKLPSSTEILRPFSFSYSTTPILFEDSQETDKELDIFHYSSVIGATLYDGRLPSTLKTIRTESFINITSQSVIIAEGTTEIEGNAFLSRTYLNNSTRTNINSVEIPASVVSFGNIYDVDTNTGERTSDIPTSSNTPPFILDGNSQLKSILFKPIEYSFTGGLLNYYGSNVLFYLHETSEFNTTDRYSHTYRKVFLEDVNEDSFSYEYDTIAQNGDWTTSEYYQIKVIPNNIPVYNTSLVDGEIVKTQVDTLTNETAYIPISLLSAKNIVVTLDSGEEVSYEAEALYSVIDSSYLIPLDAFAGRAIKNVAIIDKSGVNDNTDEDFQVANIIDFDFSQNGSIIQLEVLNNPSEVSKIEYVIDTSSNITNNASSLDWKTSETGLTIDLGNIDDYELSYPFIGVRCYNQLGEVSETVIKSYTDLIGEWITVDGVEDGQICFDFNTGTITSSETTVSKAIIPTHIKGVEVKHIGDSAFSGRNYLTEVVLPYTVETIGDSAFSNLRSRYENSYYPDTFSFRIDDSEHPSMLTTIGERVFYTWNAPSISVITKTVSITLPEGVTEIGKSCFEGVIIDQIYLPDSLESLPESAFRDTQNIKNIRFGESLKYIGDYCFYMYSGNASNPEYDNPDFISTKYGFKLPDTVEYIGTYAFANTISSLLYIYNFHFPENLKSMGDSPFGKSFASTSNVGTSYFELMFPDSLESLPNSYFGYSLPNFAVVKIHFPEYLQMSVNLNTFGISPIGAGFDYVSDSPYTIRGVDTISSFMYDYMYYEDAELIITDNIKHVEAGVFNGAYYYNTMSLRSISFFDTIETIGYRTDSEYTDYAFTGHFSYLETAYLDLSNDVDMGALPISPNAYGLSNNPIIFIRKDSILNNYYHTTPWYYALGEPSHMQGYRKVYIEDLRIPEVSLDDNLNYNDNGWAANGYFKVEISEKDIPMYRTEDLNEYTPEDNSLYSTEYREYQFTPNSNYSIEQVGVYDRATTFTPTAAEPLRITSVVVTDMTNGKNYDISVDDYYDADSFSLSIPVDFFATDNTSNTVMCTVTTIDGKTVTTEFTPNVDTYTPTTPSVRLNDDIVSVSTGMPTLSGFQYLEYRLQYEGSNFGEWISSKDVDFTIDIMNLEQIEVRQYNNAGTVSPSKVLDVLAEPEEEIDYIPTITVLGEATSNDSWFKDAVDVLIKSNADPSLGNVTSAYSLDSEQTWIEYEDSVTIIVEKITSIVAKNFY